jgi:hypothetical protein
LLREVPNGLKIACVFHYSEAKNSLAHVATLSIIAAVYKSHGRIAARVSKRPWFQLDLSKQSTVVLGRIWLFVHLRVRQCV